MKKFSKILSVALLVALVLSLGITSAFAAPVVNDHTITITSNGTGVHDFTAYQVFKGNLNAAENKLADIDWGTGVNGANLLAALKADDTLKNDFKDCTTAADVAQVLATYENNGSKLKAFSTLVVANKAAVAGTGSTDGKVPNVGTIDVTGDGYYCVVDTTTTLADGDVASANILYIVKDIDITAKDEVLKPDKKILDAQNGTATETKVAADSSAIGDTVTFNVEIKVPDTTAYVDHFVFIMNDQLPVGITYTDNLTIKIDGTSLPAENYQVTAKTGTADYAAYTVPTDPVAAVGGQAIKVVFKDFKNYVETNNLIGKTIVINYTGVVNDDAEYKATANENEVYFDFSNNPNHDYNGDEFESTDPKGTTPKSKTRTYTTSLKIKKVDQNGNALAGATFELKGTSLNRTVITGDKFEVAPYDAKDGETVEMTNGAVAVKYWKLKDGSFTTTDPVNTQNINTTQYVDPVNGEYTVYCKVHYNFAEVSTQTVDLVVVTDSNGIAEFVGLREGSDYTLEEIAAPDGYNKINGVDKFEINWTDPGPDPTKPTVPYGGFTITQKGDSAKNFTFSWVDGEGQFVTTVKNQSGATLPSTGGIGTTIFYVVGGVLVLAAIILLVTKKRMSE